MKQRLLLLTYMLASALFAGAYTVTFDVKFGSFMTEKQELSIQLYGDAGYYNAQYNESIGKFVVNDVQPGKYNCNVRYPNMMQLHLGNYGLDINSDVTVPLDFTVYHKVSFKAIDGFHLENVMVYNFNDDGGSTGSGLNDNQYYMPDGTFELRANIKSNNGIPFLSVNNKRIFTIEGTDKEIVYSIVPADYHNVTIALIGRDGQSVKSFKGELSESDDEKLYYQFNSDAEGKVILMMDNGDFQYKINSDNYSRLDGKFSVNGADVNVAATYANYKKLSVRALGTADLGNTSLTMTNMTNFDGGRSYGLIKNGNDYSGEYYLVSGIYDYQFKSSNGHYTMLETGRLNITEDKDLQIDFNRPYYPVDFKVEGDVTLIDTHGWELSVIDENGNSRNDCQIGEPLWLHEGSYRACFILGRKAADIQYYVDFIVDGAAKTVALVYDESVLHKLEISYKLPSLSEIKTYLLSGRNIDFYKNGLYCTSGELYENGSEGEILLPLGTYTYIFGNGEFGMKPLKGMVAVTDGNNQLELDLSQYGIIYAKPENNNEEDVLFSVSQGNKMVTTGWSEVGYDNDEAILLLPGGTYDIFAFGPGVTGQCRKTATLVAGSTLHETFSLANPEQEKFTVMFEVEDGTWDDNQMQYTVTLDGYGECEVEDGYGFFYNVSASDNLGYTITSPGYMPVTGSVSVTEKDSSNGFVGVYMQMKMSPTAVDRVMAVSKIAIYPTTPEDYLYIRPESESAGTWMVQLVSTTGAVVYSNQMQLEGETPVYVGNLPKGFYLLTLNNGEQRLTFKVIKR